MNTCGVAGGTPDKFGGLFKVTLNLIVIVLFGGKVKPDPVPLIGKVPPAGTGAAVVSFKFSVFSFELRAWFDLTPAREALWSAPTLAALSIRCSAASTHPLPRAVLTPSLQALTLY